MSETKPLPPCPDPRYYVLVHTKEGSYWRMKRGLGKPALLNDVLRESASRMKVTSPAAKSIIASIRHHLHDLQTGRITVKLGARLGKALKENGRMDYSFLPGYDFQPYHPMAELVRIPLQLEQVENAMRLYIDLSKDTPAIRKEAEGITGYRFSAILVKGDPLQEVRSNSMNSPVYPIQLQEDTTCVLSLMAPPEGTPWFLCLKVVVMVHGRPAEDHALKAMSIIAAG